MGDQVLRLPPGYYVHVLDSNSNTTRVEVGPMTLTRLDHEQIVLAPTKMLLVPPRHYVTIQNPVMRDERTNAVLFDKHGQARVQHGDERVLFSSPDPFPLYPGERVYGRVAPLQVVAANQALRLRCIRDFVDDGGVPAGAVKADTAAAAAAAAATTTTTTTTTGKGDDAKAKAAASAPSVKRCAGDEWLFRGPATYYPRVQVQVVEVVRAVIVKPNHAVRLKARKECVDGAGTRRLAGEEWLVAKCGAYLPGVDEEVVSTVPAHVLTDKTALHLQATRTFTDVYGKRRAAGAEWLVTHVNAATHIPDVYEKVVGEVRVTTLSSRQFAVVLDPYDTKADKVRLGQKELRHGECQFFLHPGERLERGIQSVYVLADDEALLLSAREACTTGDGVARAPGDRWMVYGPTDFIPPTQVDVVERRRAVPLDVNEGVYVRNVKTGAVTMVTGRSYMLEPNEEPFEKELPPVVEALLAAEVGSGATAKRGGGATRDRTRVVTFRAPHNTAVQIYDYKEKKSRVVLGPELVLLGPEEQFTVLSLSGDKPKRPHVIKSIALRFGPDFMTDVLVVETSDHARLSLKLSYNWHFEVDAEDPARAFTVPDFVGDACKAVASRVRGAVAQTTFDQFHKHSARVIREAVFGVDPDSQRVRNRFTFAANGLVISNIDIQSVEPVDSRTRDSLQKSVQLAIEITTKSQEATARHEAERLEQEARGRLERQRIDDEAQAEQARTALLQLVAASSTIEATGSATSEAQARAAAAAIAGDVDLKVAELKAKSQRITAQAELEMLKKKQDVEVALAAQRNKLELDKAKALSDIESAKSTAMIEALGRECIIAMSRSGPANEAALLKGLGIKSVLITDGHSPVNLLSTASGLVSGSSGSQ